MQPQDIKTDCQITTLSHIIEGPQDKHPMSLRLLIRNILGPRRVRTLKKYANDLFDFKVRLQGKKPTELPLYQPEVSLKAGDLVQVRSLIEIKATLNHWGQLKGCSFAHEMEQYCNTTQQILKPVERFVDERDFRILRTKGIYLLDGINCPGVASLGRCDRNCFFFWREEWLERIDVQPFENLSVENGH